MAALIMGPSGGSMLYGLVKPRGHKLTFVGVTLDGHAYCLEKKGAKGGANLMMFKCQHCKSWLRTDGVVLHKGTCKGGLAYKAQARKAVVDWALFVAKKTSMGMLLPFQAYGRLCGLELTQEDFDGLGDMRDLIRAAGRETAKTVMRTVKEGGKWVRKFNTRHPDGPKYAATAPRRPPKAIQVPLVQDDATNLANIEKARDQANRRLSTAIDQGRTQVYKLIAQTATIARKVVQDECELSSLMKQYDAQRDAILDRAAAAPQAVDMEQGEGADVLIRDAESISSDSSDSETSDSETSSSCTSSGSD
jgi:hypothetical protein